MARSMIPLLLTASLFIPSTGMGQMYRQVESLKGIDAFQVDVSVAGECLGESEMKSVEASLRVRLELSLRKEGVGIAADAPVLQLIVQALRAPTGLCGYMYQLALIEVVPLRGRGAAAITWERSGVALVGESNFREGTLSAMDEDFTHFLNDYLTANPKE